MVTRLDDSRAVFEEFSHRVRVRLVQRIMQLEDNQQRYLPRRLNKYWKQLQDDQIRSVAPASVSVQELQDIKRHIPDIARINFGLQNNKYLENGWGHRQYIQRPIKINQEILACLSGFRCLNEIDFGENFEWTNGGEELCGHLSSWLHVHGQNVQKISFREVSPSNAAHLRFLIRNLNSCCVQMSISIKFQRFIGETRLVLLRGILPVLRSSQYVTVRIECDYTISTLIERLLPEFLAFPQISFKVTKLHVFNPVDWGIIDQIYEQNSSSSNQFSVEQIVIRLPRKEDSSSVSFLGAAQYFHQPVSHSYITMNISNHRLHKEDFFSLEKFYSSKNVNQVVEFRCQTVPDFLETLSQLPQLRSASINVLNIINADFQASQKVPYQDRSKLYKASSEQFSRKSRKDSVFQDQLSKIRSLQICNVKDGNAWWLQYCNKLQELYIEQEEDFPEMNGDCFRNLTSLEIWSSRTYIEYLLQKNQLENLKSLFISNLSFGNGQVLYEQVKSLKMLRSLVIKY